MRVHEFAKQLTAELGKEVKSSQIIDILSGKKEGLKAQSSIDEICAGVFGRKQAG